MAIKDEYQTQEARISGRKTILRKGFIKDFIMALFFIAVFAGAFFIAWDIFIYRISNRGHTVWICVGIAFFTAILITTLVNFLIFKFPKYIKKHKQQKAHKKRKKKGNNLD